MLGKTRHEELPSKSLPVEGDPSDLMNTGRWVVPYGEGRNSVFYLDGPAGTGALAIVHPFETWERYNDSHVNRLFPGLDITGHIAVGALVGAAAAGLGVWYMKR